MNLDNELKNYLGAIIKYSKQMYLESSVSDKDDLMQAGFIGMVNGLESYNADRAKTSGTKKTTYVIQCIRNAILQEANKFYGAISLPHNKRLRLNAFKKLLSQGMPRDDIKSKMTMNDAEFDELNALAQLKNVSTLSVLIEDKSFSPDEILITPSDYNLDAEELGILNAKLSGMKYNKIAEEHNVDSDTMRKRIQKIVNKVKKAIEDNG